MDNQQASIKKNATNYGLILGGVLALITTVLYAVSLESLTKWWVGIISFLIALVFGIVSTAKSKAILGGYMTFKQAFTSYFITIAIGIFISILVSIIIFNFVDPDAAVYLKEQIMEVSRDMMERFGTPEAAMEEAMTKMEEEDTFGVLKQLQSYAIQLVIYSVFGLLIALIMKRKDPNAIN